MKDNEKTLTLWAESPEEARIFLSRASRQGFVNRIGTIYVAKKSSKNRTNAYVAGFYYYTSNDEEVTVYQDVLTAPSRIRELVQWCTCDVMLSCGDVPILVLEDTTHIVRMNVYQRVPRLFKAAMLGVPALTLQGTRGLDFSKRGDCWGFHRYMRAFAAISKRYPNTAVLSFYYIPDDPTHTELKAEEEVFSYIDAIASDDSTRANTIRAETIKDAEQISANGFRGHFARDIQSINVLEDKVIVNIGANPDKKSWKEKGSGQMDPYIGLIAAAKYIYCFDKKGHQDKEMVVRFKYIPNDFWWFKDWKTSTSLYKTLAFEIADKVEFLGT